MRVLTYLCGKGIEPKIPWYSAQNFNEEEKYNSGSDKCSIFTNEKKESNPVEDAQNIDKIIDSIDNSISHNYVSKSDIENLLKPREKTKSDTDSDSDLDLDLENKQKGGKKNKNKIKNLKCDTLKTANKCKNDSECVWNNGCEEKICHSAEDKETCESDEIYDAKCYWDNLDELNKCKHRPS